MHDFEIMFDFKFGPDEHRAELITYPTVKVRAENVEDALAVFKEQNSKGQDIENIVVISVSMLNDEEEEEK